ncbi:PREDICTED: LOW QUALITY PROTEIN: actin-like protein 9, partial [Fulmarus glacialis]|uniref:LOW QUALITY PROTEIN: actin-like protein 9 n=1 Tax=Fulmarus glacialis TaxID=30455 RepID=UPI00051BCF6F
MSPGPHRSVRTISSNTSSSSSSEELELGTGAVVIDMGTRSRKAGFSGQQTPIAKINTHGIAPRVGRRQVRGEEALLYPDTEIMEPMQNSIIISWEASKTLWQHLFDHELQVPPKGYALLITEPLLSPITHREKMVEAVFESLGSPSLLCSPACPLHLRPWQNQRSAAPVHEGYSLAYATERLDLVGSCLSWYLMTLLGDMGYMLSNKMAHMVEDIKHKCCYVASNFKSECQ